MSGPQAGNGCGDDVGVECADRLTWVEHDPESKHLPEVVSHGLQVTDLFGDGWVAGVERVHGSGDFDAE